MISGIYSIKNKINGKQYIGRSSDIELRWKKHQYLLSNDKHYNPHLQRAWNKYGESNFEFTIIEECDFNISGEREHYWIINLQTHNLEKGYNKSLGGEGEIPTEETRLKRSRSLKGKRLGMKHSEEAKRKIGEAGKGRKHSPESIMKIKIANTGENHPFFGKKLSKEHREHMSEAHKGEKNHFYGKKHNDETKRKIGDANRGERSHFYGTTLTEEQKQHLSEMRKGERNPFYGRKHSEETKRKIAEASRGNTPTNKGVFKYPMDVIKDIYKRSKNGETRKALSEEYGIPKTTVRAIVLAEGRYSFLKDEEVGVIS